MACDTGREFLQRHHDERLRRAWAGLPSDPRSLEPDEDPLSRWLGPIPPADAPVEPLAYQGPCEPCRHFAARDMAICYPCMTPSRAGHNEKYRFEPISVGNEGSAA